MTLAEAEVNAWRSELRAALRQMTAPTADRSSTPTEIVQAAIVQRRFCCAPSEAPRDAGAVRMTLITMAIGAAAHRRTV